jgi:AcrR family transcriptional regulator
LYNEILEVNRGMSPRSYQLGQRQVAVDENRARILVAARELLMTDGGFPGFTMEAVARMAGVARMTVYYQFGSKVGLLEALCDSLAARGGMEHFGNAFRRPDPLDTLGAFIAGLVRFWNTDRLVIRRIRALATLDPEFAHVLAGRDERRREGLRVVLRRLANAYGRPAPDAVEGAVDVLRALISFEMLDALAGEERSLEEVAPEVHHLALAALGYESGR